jgi:ribokinase
MTVVVRLHTRTRVIGFRFHEYVAASAALRAPRIAVVGSFAMGLTMKVPRLPSSGETLLATGYRVDYGGKGSNQAVGCARLGAEAAFVAKIGKDAFGESALRLYADEGIDISQATQTSEAPTGVGFIIVEASSGRNCITIDPGANELLSPGDVGRGLATLRPPDVVLTQLETPVEAAEAALAYGRAHLAITILNPAPVRPLPTSVLQLVDVMTPNEVEARVLVAGSPDGGGEAEDVARELIGAGVKQVVMTLGENGALIVSEEAATRIPAIKVTPVDTTGAGDAFNAGLAVALASGADLEEAVRFAVVTGGLAVTKEGVIPSLPFRENVLESYRQRGLTPSNWLCA